MELPSTPVANSHAAVTGLMSVATSWPASARLRAGQRRPHSCSGIGGTVHQLSFGGAAKNGADAMNERDSIARRIREAVDQGFAKLTIAAVFLRVLIGSRHSVRTLIYGQRKRLEV